MTGVRVNGYPCKDIANVTAADFYFEGIANALVPNNSFNVAISTAFVDQVPGINTLGISMVRADFGPGGLVPPHTHPRATEMIFVLDGVVNVSFITTSNVVISQTVKKGGVFVVPFGLVHYLKNIGKEPASVLAALNSQFAGTFAWSLTLFRAQPAIPDDILATTFQISNEEVQKIRSGLSPSPS